MEGNRTVERLKRNKKDDEMDTNGKETRERGKAAGGRGVKKKRKSERERAEETRRGREKAKESARWEEGRGMR